MNRVTYSGNPACSEKLPRRCFGTECGPRRASCPAITFALGLFMAVLLSMPDECGATFAPGPYGPDDTNDFPCPTCPWPAGWNGPSGSSCSGCQDGGPHGMPMWWVSEPYMNLWISDEPLGYQPAVGPRVSFFLNYKQREKVAGYNTELSNVGKNWNLSWISYVQDPDVYASVFRLGNGCARSLNPDGATVDYYTHLMMQRLTDTNSNTTGFELLYPDGSKDVYTSVPHTFAGVTFISYFLTAKADPDGNQLTFIYDTTSAVVRLLYVVDGDNRTNTLSYSGPGSSLITRVTDPFGRSVRLSYDSEGLLTNIIDVAGLSTSFTYLDSTNVWMTRMVTPYGANSFRYTISSEFTGPNSYTNLNGRMVEIAEPDGSRQLYVYRDGLSNVFPNVYPTNQVPVTTNSNFSLASSFDNTAMFDRNSFHWGRHQYEGLSSDYLNSGNISNLTAADYALARLKHWLKRQDGSGRIGRTLSLERLPNPDGGIPNGQKTWFDYAGKSASDTEGGEVLPLFVARVLPDNTTQFSYSARNSLGRMTQDTSTYTKADGAVDLRTTSYQYAPNEIDVVTITDPLGVQVSSNWFNAHHQVLTNYNALNEMTVWTYNDRQQIDGVHYPSGLITTNYYNGWNQLVATIDLAVSNGNTIYYRTNAYSYAKDLVALHTDERGLTTAYYYDDLQRLTTEVDPRGTNSYFYDKLDLVKTVDRMGHIHSFGYNRLRQKIAETNALGVVTTYGYCLCGSPTYVTNAVGTALQQITQFIYDFQGRKTFVLYPDNSSVTYRYDSLGRIINVFDSFGHGVGQFYNNQGIFVAANNYYGQLQAVAYDILDRPTSVTDANGVKVSNTYDNLGRLLSRGYPDGGVERFGYTTNIAGVTSYTNQLGTNVVNYAYDPLGRRTNEVYPGIATNSFAYDGAGSLTSLTDGSGQATRWTYDLFGRVYSKADTRGAILFSYAYYPTDWLLKRVDASNRSTTYSYDAAGNLTRIVYPSRTNSYAYDALNRLTGMVDTIGGNEYACNYTYVPGGFLQSEDGPWANDTVTYTWNNGLSSGLSLAQPDGSWWTQSYGYDAANRLQTLVAPAGTFTYTYQGAGNWVINLALPNGAVVANAFDSVGRLTGTWLKNSRGAVLNSHAYNNNVANQRLKQTRGDGSYVNYSYDNIGELNTAFGYENTGAARLHEKFGYAYDAAGNLHYRANNALIQTFTVNNLNQLDNVTRAGTLTVAGTTGSAASEVTVNGSAASRYNDYTFALAGFTVNNGDNAYTVIARDAFGRADTNSVTVNLPATVSYVYDSNRNLINDGLRRFDYDDENQLIRVTVLNRWKSEFTYDGRMRRRISRDYTWNGSWVLSKEVRYVYDGDLVIQERDGANNPLATYTRGLDLSGTFQGAGGIGGLLARTDSGHAYYHADGSGNITALIDSGQAVVARYIYDPFGNTLAKSGPLGDANLYRFSSKEAHPNSGLYYYGYRFYDPNLQRWPNRDPIEERGGINLYSFVRDDPVDWIDYLGLECSITIRRYLGPAAHQWISDGSINIGFYPGKMFGAPGKGVWVIEDQFTSQVNAHGGNRPDPSDPNNYYEWDTKKKNHGKLPDGTPCSAATCQQIIDCINNAIIADPAPKFNPLFNNCRQRSKRTLGDCCLSQGGMAHKPPNGRGCGGRSTGDITGGSSELTK